MSKLRLEGKVAIITGAASGIGEAAARLFAENGALVVIADIQDELGHQVVASIGPHKSCYRHCDVRDEKQIQETVDYALEKYGSLDILFSVEPDPGRANAGIIGPLGGILDLDMGEFDNTMAVNMSNNMRGAVIAIKHTGRAMVTRQIRGSIICNASVTGCVAGAGPHAYTISKHALVGLIRTASCEFGKHGIRVNCISPSPLVTPMADSANLSMSEMEALCSAASNLKGTVLRSHHVAETALFLASDESSFISGHNLTIDGGFTVINPILGFYK
ncbi:short-chain dehydrogenase reductase 3b-like [Tasmannia lanceolata]|uniref:short-chain dehydrogenase reductase 3b-like n=1 Tax=Tasmannia lanceolata TaxID=3420 RepID=UPI0040633510